MLKKVYARTGWLIPLPEAFYKMQWQLLSNPCAPHLESASKKANHKCMSLTEKLFLYRNVENWISSTSKKLPLLLDTPAKAVLPRSVPMAHTEKIPWRARRNQQGYCQGSAAGSPSPPKPATCWYSRNAAAFAGPAPSHA